MEGHHFSWQSIPDDYVGETTSMVVLGCADHVVMVGGEQLVTGPFTIPDGALVTLHCWIVEKVQDGTVTWQCGPMSEQILVPEPLSADFCRVSEVCAGLGGTMFGAVACGLRPFVALDQSTLSCQLLRLNQFPVVIQGDLRQLPTLARFHLANVQHRTGLLSGFPCQPFGTLGQARAFDDPRAFTFFAVLDLAWLVQAAWVLLECVIGAGQHPKVLASIESFCQARGFRFVTMTLHLDHALPCKRTRWWCLMYPEWLPMIDIPDLPVAPGRQCLADVFSFLAIMAFGGRNAA